MTLKSDRDNILENENRIKDCSQLRVMSLSLAFSAEKMTEDATKVLIVDAYHYVQKKMWRENKE